MKGLLVIPSEELLLAAYGRLDQYIPSTSSTNALVTESEIALWSQWSRFDPRFAELLVSYLARHWTALLPEKVNVEVLKQPWPSALGVLLEHAQTIATQPRKFRLFAQLVMQNIEPATPQHFFIGLRKLSGKEIQKDVELRIPPYTKWGYFGRDWLINKATSKKLPTKKPVVL